MNYFTESLLSLPSYIPDDIFKPDFSLLSLQDILSKPLSPKDRRDLNKIYEQADIFVKRNSIIMINNKKQKKLLGTTNQGVTQPILNKSIKEDSLQPPLQIIGRENAFFQEVHPTDVEKNHEDNIFDYRLHLKLARGEQIFKVQEIKRKTKKRNIAGKECECCGKEVMRNHQCKHTFCEQKCGKVIKRIDSKKDAGSSMMSDSKDENWSDQNYDEEKAARAHASRRQNEKKSRMNRRQSSNCNKDPMNYGEPSEVLLASIEKLLESEHNNFIYRVIEIKEYESEEEEEQDQFDEDKEMHLQGWEHKELYIEDEIKDEENQEFVSLQKDEKSSNKLRSADIFLNQKNNQEAFALNPFEKQFQLSSNQKVNNLSKTGESNPLIENHIKQSQKQQQKGIEERLESRFISYNQKLVKLNVRSSKVEEQFNSMQIKKIQPSLVQNQQKQVEKGEKSVPQQEKQSASNRSETQRQKKTQTSAQNFLKTSHQSQLSVPVASQNFRTPSSQSDSEENRQKEIQEKFGQISVQNDSRNKEIKNLSSSSEELLKQEKNDQQMKVEKMQMDQNQDIESIPDFKSQNSLDDQIDDIIDPEGNQATDNKKNSSYKTNLAKKLSGEVPEKLSKKDSKKIKVIERERLMSEKIEDIDPIQDMEEKDQPQKVNSEKDQNQYHQEKEQWKGRGRGKGHGMCRGKGIFEEELDIYQEDSQMLESQNEDSEQEQVDNQFQKPLVQKKPKLTVPASSSHMNPSSNSPPIHHPLTPKRHIPNMETIIKKIQIQTQNNAYQKGLGRGKVFGRGLGVLEETEELEKEVEEDGLEIVQKKQEEKIGQARKRLKIAQKKQQKSRPDEDSQFSMSSQREFCGKFQQLIEQKEDQKINPPENLYQNKSCQNDNIEAMYYKRYLEKRQSIAVGLGSKFELSEEEVLEEDPQKQQREYQDRQKQLKAVSWKLSDGGEVIFQEDNLSQQEEPESMINLNGQNPFKSNRNTPNKNQ